jgi:hypothetical protein
MRHRTYLAALMVSKKWELATARTSIMGFKESEAELLEEWAYKAGIFIHMLQTKSKVMRAVQEWKPRHQQSSVQIDHIFSWRVLLLVLSLMRDKKAAAAAATWVNFGSSWVQLPIKRLLSPIVLG